MEQKLSFKNNIGYLLSAVISIPDGNEKFPMVIACHGYLGHKNSETNISLDKELNKRGIAFLRFDFTGHGESQGDIGEVNASQAVQDLIYAFDNLKQFRNIDFARIGLLGTSFGGNVVLRYASNNDNYKSIVLKSPVSEFVRAKSFKIDMEWIRKNKNKAAEEINQYKEKYKFYSDFVQDNAYEISKKVNSKILIIHGDKDEVVPLTQSVKLCSAFGENASLKVIEGGDHNLAEQKDNLVKMIADFFEDTL